MCIGRSEILRLCQKDEKEEDKRKRGLSGSSGDGNNPATVFVSQKRGISGLFGEIIRLLSFQNEAGATKNITLWTCW